MYFIIEMQITDGVGSTIVTTKETQNEADSEYYRILQYAAISDVPKHGALIVDDNCQPIRCDCYTHESEETPDEI